MLQRLHPATEFQQASPDRGVVDLRQITGQLFIGDAHGCRHGAKLHAQKLRIRASHIGRL